MREPARKTLGGVVAFLGNWFVTPLVAFATRKARQSDLEGDGAG
jgi:hypothetical protein